jgi:hypothetical protein
VAPPAVGVLAGIAASFAQSGWMAIEGRVRDTKSGKMVMFADREQSKTRARRSGLTWYGHAHESVHDRAISWWCFEHAEGRLRRGRLLLGCGR